MLALTALVLRGPSVMFLTGPEITMLKPEVTSGKKNTSNYQTLGRSDTNNFKYLQNCPTLASLHSNLCYVSFAHISTQAWRFRSCYPRLNSKKLAAAASEQHHEASWQMLIAVSSALWDSMRCHFFLASSVHPIVLWEPLEPFSSHVLCLNCPSWTKMTSWLQPPQPLFPAQTLRVRFFQLSCICSMWI